MLARLCLALPFLLALPARAAELVLVETPFEASESAVLARDLATGAERRVARLPHAPGWSAEGALSPNGRLLAAAVLDGGNRPWRHASVHLVDLERGETRRLLDEAILDAPLWTPGGALLATRAVAEYDPPVEDARRGRLMDLDLEVVELDLGGGAPRVVLRDRCNALDLLGVLATGEIALLRAGWDGHRLLAWRPGGGLRRIAELGPATPGYPRIAPGGGAVVFQQVVDRREGLWSIVEVDLSGTRRELARLAHPFACAVPLGPLVAFTAPDGGAVELLGGDGRITRTLWRDPGAERLVATRALAGGRLVVLERQAGGPAQTFVVEVESGRRHEVPAPSGRWRRAIGLRGSP